MQRLKRLVIGIGSLPPRAALWGFTLVFCAWVLLDIFVLHASAGLSRPTYDAMVRLRAWSAPADPRLLIVDIDEPSLQRMAPAFGRWPWPRDTLATVATYLEQQGAAAIVWDIAFADADRVSPGGDAAFDAAAAASPHSVFPVIRLPAQADAQSQVRRDALPGLWARPGQGTHAVAMVPPVFASMARASLGFNNVPTDPDGVVRRYRLFETLPDGGVLASLAAATLRVVDPPRWERAVAQARPGAAGALVDWRSRDRVYPRVAFADVFDSADRGRPPPVDLRGRILLVGSTAASLHDIHPTPLAGAAPGIETLATAIDNALHARELRELPLAVQAVVAVLTCVVLAWVAHRRSIATLQPLLLVVPLSLLAVSYLSLLGSGWFIDLHLAASFALLYLGIVRGWRTLQRFYWFGQPVARTAPVALWAWHRQRPWDSAAQERLMLALRRHAPALRIVGNDAYATTYAPHWPELARDLALAGPVDAVESARTALAPAVRDLHVIASDPVVLPAGASPAELSTVCLREWTGLRLQRAAA
jgi:CHASE2 domain-containing sensor protein